MSRDWRIAWDVLQNKLTPLQQAVRSFQEGGPL
jgi:hypothetical protein